MRQLLIALPLLAAGIAGASADAAGLKQALVGRWGEDAGCQSGTLGFGADGSLTITNPGQPPIRGTYALADTKLTATVPGRTLDPVTVTVEAATLTLTYPDGHTDKAMRCSVQ